MDREPRRDIKVGMAELGSPAGAVSAATIADLFAAAVAQHQKGALAEAERQYRHLLTLAPNHADSLHNLGLVALHSGNAPAAVELIGQAIAISGGVAEYHYSIALAFRVLGRIDDVATHLERAIAIRSNYALAHLNLGNVRHAQGRIADAIVCYERVIALGPNAGLANFNLANIMAEQGRWDEAVASYKQALKFEPSHAETHAKLGLALLALGKPAEAIPHCEQALVFDPKLFDTYQSLSKAFLTTGNLEAAIDTATRAISIAETPQNKALFGQCIRYAQFSADNAQFRKLLLRALNEGWVRPRELARVCISLVKLGAAVKDGIARSNAAWPTRLSAAELSGPTGPAALAQDTLLCGLLECDPITDVDLERFLTSVRHVMLTAAMADAPDDAVLGLYCALARQCFVNEYVFSVTDAEAGEVGKLRAALEQALAAGEPCPVLWLVAIAAYGSLHNVSNAQALLQRSWPPAVEALLVQQIAEPAEERRLASDMPVITEIGGEVSHQVRQQYEQSPYPRWVKAGPPAQPVILFERRPEEVGDVLIAGCGTGLSAIEFARHARGARILAIDLSLASLSYAKRMAQSLGIANIEFAQADITRLGTIGRNFDFIDVSGVLHHLADPWQGWQILLSLLRPGGTMQVGLYSELARRNVVAGRELIAARGYQPTTEDIRRCREDIIASANPLLQSVTRSADFFTTSECRDLLFHVQEHRTTLPAIKSFLDANNVQFAGFFADAVNQSRFSARFRDPAALANLDCWHTFETEAPDTFVNMYLFWIRKPFV